MHFYNNKSNNCYYCSCCCRFESPFGTTVTEFLSVINHSRRGSLSNDDDTSITDDDYYMHYASDNLYDDIGPDYSKGTRSPLTQNASSTNPAPSSAAVARQDSDFYGELPPAISTSEAPPPPLPPRPAHLRRPTELSLAPPPRPPPYAPPPLPPRPLR